LRFTLNLSDSLAGKEATCFIAGSFVNIALTICSASFASVENLAVVVDEHRQLAQARSDHNLSGSLTSAVSMSTLSQARLA